MPAKFEKQYVYISPDGEQFATLAKAQEHELLLWACGDKTPTDTEIKVVSALLRDKQTIIGILSQRERKNASPATKAARKPRTKKAAPVEGPSDNWKTHEKAA